MDGLDWQGGRIAKFNLVHQSCDFCPDDGGSYFHRQKIPQTNNKKGITSLSTRTLVKNIITLAFNP